MTHSFPKTFIYLALFIAGAIQPLTFAPFDFWFLGPISIALILLITQGLAPKSSLQISTKKGFLYGWLFGLGLFGVGASWVYVSIHNFGHASAFLAGSLTFIFICGIALFSGLIFSAFFKFRTNSILQNALLFLVIWVLGDEFRTEFLTGFPWLFLGYGHLHSPLAGWIPILGVYGVTLITVATGISLTLLLSVRFSPRTSLPLTPLSAPAPLSVPLSSPANVSSKVNIVVIVISAFWLAGPILNQISWSHQKGKTRSVALVQSNIPQELKWKRSQRFKTMQLLEQLSQEHWQDDLIIWPETAVPMLYDLAEPFLRKMSEQAAANDSTIISGIPSREINPATGAQTIHNSIVSIGKGSGIYHKQKLVPFGEYVPLQDYLRGLIAFFDLPMSDFRKGSANQALLKSFDFQIAPFICYEVVYPDFVASRAKNADILLTISNDSWFGASLGPLQHLEMAQMRAAENGRYMIRATNNGISAVIDERGQIISQSQQFVQTTLESKVKIMEGRTPFSYFGSLPLFILCGIYLLGTLLNARLKARKTGQDATPAV